VILFCIVLALIGKELVKIQVLFGSPYVITYTIQREETCPMNRLMRWPNHLGRIPFIIVLGALFPLFRSAGSGSVRTGRCLWRRSQPVSSYS
jgi:hypothetical protein